MDAVEGFAALLDSDRFLVTAELNPPKGTDLTRLIAKAEDLRGAVDGFNITDSAASLMTMSGLSVAHLLGDRGIETIMQISGRDRNRLALQSDLLGAAALGVSNVLCMSGDPPSAGDHPDAKPVFDLDAIALLKAGSALNSGEDLAGKPLKGTPSLCLGAVATPGAPDMGKELRRTDDKVKAGARFFQTQAVYRPDQFAGFMDSARPLGVPILAGIILLKSGDMARNLNANLPGIDVPEALIEEMDRAGDRRRASVEIAGRIIREIRPMCQGVHIMSIGWESRIPEVLEAAGLSGER